MNNTKRGDTGFAIGERNRDLIFRWFQKNPCGNQGECSKALGLSRSVVQRAAAAIRDGWRPTDPNKAYSTAAWGVATHHCGVFSPLVAPLAGHIDDLIGEHVELAVNNALDLSAERVFEPIQKQNILAMKTHKYGDPDA